MLKLDMLFFDIYQSLDVHLFARYFHIILEPSWAGYSIAEILIWTTLSPEKVVYVSCNPSTQARDIKLFVEGGYKLVKIRPVDMFPHTYHIENVTLLSKPV